MNRAPSAHGCARPSPEGPGCVRAHRPGRALAVLGVLALALLLAGCATAPSTLDTRGPRAARIADLWWLMFWLSMGVYALVIGVLAGALLRRRSRENRRGALGWTRHSEGRVTRFGGTALIVAGGIVLPVAILLPLAVITFRDVAALAAPDRPASFTIEVIGYQFWWEVRYPEQGVITANEIHIPVGEPVRLVMTSTDVIHSFWVPQLMGKHDLTPGRVHETWVEADQAGTYWGQCAEFCGLQHAHMAFVLVAEPPEQFAAWVELQQRPAVEPVEPLARRGAGVFARAGCIECHAIQYGLGAPRVGGQAGDKHGPDLTHVASRLTLAAGTLENTRGNLAGWIANPQAIKPGNRMPVIPLDSESLLALVAYLETLE